MPIPNADNAVVPDEKLGGYLLCESHPVGGAKARWFFSLGYRVDQPERLEEDLLDLVRRSEVFRMETSPFGVKYMVSGPISPPSGRAVALLTVWIAEAGTTGPRFVTAYPGEEVSNEIA